MVCFTLKVELEDIASCKGCPALFPSGAFNRCNVLNRWTSTSRLSNCPLESEGGEDIIVPESFRKELRRLARASGVILRGDGMPPARYIALTYQKHTDIIPVKIWDEEWDLLSKPRFMPSEAISVILTKAQPAQITVNQLWKKIMDRERE